MNNGLTIGRLAKSAGVGVETIRYYERRGLVAQPGRPLSGYRVYAQATVSRLRFIKRAQGLGFTLEEIIELLRLEDGRSCRETRQLAQRKVAMIEERIADLNRMRRALETLIAECEEGRPRQVCPIIVALAATAT